MAEIQVYGYFPRVVELGADLNLDGANWQWVHRLTLPLETLNALQFSPKQYKWIRYPIGIVVGAQGDLSSSSDSLNIVDYNASLPTKSATLYYHTSDEERRRMFPRDPKTARTDVTSSIATSREAQFRSNTANQDKNQCTLTGRMSFICDAIHLLVHSKGDAYISTYTERRSRDPAGGDLIHDIHNVQNGLFLNTITHRGVGEHVAFLPTPNFAMDTSDIDPAAPPKEKRCTTHLFEPSRPHYLGGLGALPSGTPLRISGTPDQRPPAILFDSVYASTVLHHFGTHTLKDFVAATWMDTFYPDGVMDPDAKARTKEERMERREQVRQARSVPDPFDMLSVPPYILVPPNKLQATLLEAEEKAGEKEKRRVQEKVDAWNEQVNRAS